MSSRLVEIFEDIKLVEKIKKAFTLTVPTCRSRKFKSNKSFANGLKQQ